MRSKRVFIIGAGFSKATCKRAPLGRELLKYLEDTYDNFTFENSNLYRSSLKKSLELGRKASSHFREIVRHLDDNFYSTKFDESEENKQIRNNFSSQFDLELLLSLLVIHQEIFFRSNIDYGDTIELRFYEFINWSILQTLSPYLVKDDQSLAEKFCKKFLSKGDTIISFNYDIILDLALNISKLWHPVNNRNKSYFCSYWDKEIIPMDKTILDILKTLSGKNLIDYIKIHGSINWYYSDHFYDSGIEDELSRDLAKLFYSENGKCIFNAELKINPNKYLDNRNYKNIHELCILKPTLGKKYLKYPFSYLTNKSIKHISEATEIFVIGYSFPLYDTLSEIFILSTKPNCRITIVNYGKETERIKERIVRSGGIKWENVNICDKGLEYWINNN